MKLSQFRALLLATLMAASFVWLGRHYYHTFKASRQETDDLVGFWWVDTTELAKGDGPLPEPFVYCGDTVVRHFFVERLQPGAEQKSYLRLRTKREGTDYFYLSHVKDHTGYYPWIKFATLENGHFYVNVSGRKWRLTKMTEDEVDPNFSEYFLPIPVYQYSAPAMPHEVILRLLKERS
jgi:hypothetical protein